tara:strand:+ start:385 stop:909 length:525 start_codon:yes stop_codon:yes gene_type:complete
MIESVQNPQELENARDQARAQEEAKLAAEQDRIKKRLALGLAQDLKMIEEREYKISYAERKEKKYQIWRKWKYTQMKPVLDRLPRYLVTHFHAGKYEDYKFKLPSYSHLKDTMDDLKEIRSLSTPDELRLIQFYCGNCSTERSRRDGWGTVAPVRRRYRFPPGDPRKSWKCHRK